MSVGSGHGDSAAPEGHDDLNELTAPPLIENLSEGRSIHLHDRLAAWSSSSRRPRRLAGTDSLRSRLCAPGFYPALLRVHLPERHRRGLSSGNLCCQCPWVCDATHVLRFTCRRYDRLQLARFLTGRSVIAH